MSARSRKRKPKIDERAAPADAAEKIRNLDLARVRAENEVTKTIENVALGMDLKREKGWSSWAYDVPSGKYSRRELPASPST